MKATWLVLINGSALPRGSVTVVPGTFKARVKFKYDLNPTSNYFPPSRLDPSQTERASLATVKLGIVTDGESFSVH